MNDSFPFLLNTVDLCFEGFVDFPHLHNFCHLECHFNTTIAVCDGCHA